MGTAPAGVVAGSRAYKITSPSRGGSCSRGAAGRQGAGGWRGYGHRTTGRGCGFSSLQNHQPVRAGQLYREWLVGGGGSGWVLVGGRAQALDPKASVDREFVPPLEIERDRVNLSPR
jgi:hypothetical protein